MTTDWTAEQISVYEDFKAEGFALLVRAPGGAGEWVPEIDEFIGEGSDQDTTTYALKIGYTARQIDGKIIQQNDTMLKIPAYGLPDITLSHEILIDGKVQNTVNIKAVSPGNVPLIYEVQVRS